jgi:hypothetical protein
MGCSPLLPIHDGTTSTRLLSGFMAYEYLMDSATDATVNTTLRRWADGGWDLYTATSVYRGQGSKQNPGQTWHYLYFCRER